MQKALSIIASIVIIIVGIVWLTKKPPVLFDANGFPKGAKEGDHYTKGGIVYTFTNGIWMQPSGGGQIVYPSNPTIGQVWIDINGVSHTFTSAGWIVTPSGGRFGYAIPFPLPGYKLGSQIGKVYCIKKNLGTKCAKYLYGGPTRAIIGDLLSENTDSCCYILR